MRSSRSAQADHPRLSSRGTEARRGSSAVAEDDGGRAADGRAGVRLAGLLLIAALLSGQASAETLKVAVGQRGNWDTAVAELGQRGGIFKKYGLDLDILYTSGGGETQQAVLSRSVQIGVAAGTLGVLGAFSKGAPVRIIGGQATGAADYWYVPAASPIRTIADLAGHTIAFSTVGSSTNSIVLTLAAQDHLSFTPVATGSPPATFTQTMSGQIDVGWAAPPFGLDALKDGKIRFVFRGNDLPAIRVQTTRVLITHAAELAQDKAAVDRFMQGYRATLNWMYSNPDALTIFAQYAGVSDAVAKTTRDEFFPKAMLEPDTISGIDEVMADGVKFKFLSAPLTKAQLAQVIRIPPDAPLGDAP
jgi:NitT/TauT family transport system substrate-binding protein